MTRPITIVHDTIHLERRYPAAPSAVFAAYADPAARAAWTVPSDDETLVYSETDFTVGGIDHFLCGPKADPSIVGTTRYELIERDTLIVCRERISKDDRLLSLSTIVWQLAADGDGTMLTVTDQITALGAPEMLEGSRSGYDAALANLDRWLAEHPAPLGGIDPTVADRP